MTKNITFFGSSLRGGGAEKVSVNLANGFINRGYNITYVVLNLTDAVYQDLLSEAVKLVNLNVAHARNSFFHIHKFLRKNKTDTILTFTHEIAIVLLIVRFIFRLNFKLIARNINPLSKTKEFEKSIWHKYIKDEIIKILYKKVDHLIVQSEQMKQDVINYYHFDPSAISVINNPLLPEFEKEARTTEYVPAEKQNEILFVGRLHEQKGLFYLIDAFKIISKEQPEVKLRIVGKGDLKDDLKNHVKELNLQNSIIFEGFSDQLIPYYKRAMLTVLTSLYEGFPNVLLESIATGTPVVSFDCKSGPGEIIIDGVNGFLTRYKDINHFAESVLEALDYKWNSDSIKKTVQKFYLNEILNQYEQVITGRKN